MTAPTKSRDQGGWRSYLRIPVDRAFLADGALFFANFFIAKMSIYAAPLVIATIATGPVYGAIELAQSFGLLVTSFVIGAPLAGITQNYLIRGDARVVDQLAAISAIFSGLSLLFFGAFWAWGIESSIQLVTAAFASAVLHNVAATWFRMRAARNLSAWVDGTALLSSLLIVAIAVLLTGQAQMATITSGYLILAAIVTILSGLLALRTISSGLLSRLVESTRVGIPMVVVGTMATWLGVGGRMTVGLLDAHNVAAYGVAFRIAGLALGLHQLAVTGLFAMLYRARTRMADFVISLFLAGVGIIVLGIGFSGRLIIGNFDFAALDQNGRDVFVKILPIVCVQTFYWIAYAMTQLRINRSRLAGKSILPTVFITFGGIAVIFGSSYFLDIGIAVLCWLIALHAAAFFFLNIYMLGQVGRMPHKKIMGVGILGGAILALAAVAGNFSL
jgi:hypothetical protein